MADIRPDRLKTCQSERKLVISRWPSVLGYETIQVPTIFHATHVEDISLRKTGPFDASLFCLRRYMKEIFCTGAQQLKLFVYLTNEEMRNVYKTLVWKPLGYQSFGTSRRWRKDYIKVDFQKMDCEEGDELDWLRIHVQLQNPGGGVVRLLALRLLLAYCTSLGW
jgi:hypothetical protein